MPVLMPNGEYKRRNELNLPNPNRTKRHKQVPRANKTYQSARVINTIRRYPKKITQEQATQIYDAQLARHLRNITRED